MAGLKVFFSHGQESGPWGTKITAMAEVAKEEGCRVTSVDYQGMADPNERTMKLIGECAEVKGNLLLVGSSMGGHVATAAAIRLRPVGVFVLAPAYFMPGYEKMTPLPPACPLVIVHGWNDTVVPVDNSIRYARDAAADLHVIDADHRLTANLAQINQLFREFIRRIK